MKNLLIIKNFISTYKETDNRNNGHTHDSNQRRLTEYKSYKQAFFTLSLTDTTFPLTMPITLNHFQDWKTQGSTLKGLIYVQDLMFRLHFLHEGS